MEIKKKGFTLAELLITIGIIGVVAALTIPTLVNNYQTRSWNISSSNFEAKFGEALKIMNTQQSLSNLATTERFVNELQKHMKIAKVCNNEELTLCFPDEINGSTSVIDVTDPTTYENNSSTPTQIKTIKTAKELGQKDWNTNTMGVQFANGVSAILAYNPKCSANPFDVNAVTVSGGKENITFGTDCVAMVYDISSNAQPNELHKDIRTSSMASVGDGDCAFKIEGICYSAPFVPSPISYADCAGENANSSGNTTKAGKEMSDLGIKYCYQETDYWAGAVKKCGGVDKLPTLNHLKLLARYLYDLDNNSTPSNIVPSRVESTIGGKLARSFWSNDQPGYYANGSHGIYLSYRDPNTYEGFAKRYNSTLNAFCVMD